MANRYWVGGGSSTNWNATGNTNWSATDGGANNASVPTNGDDVFLKSAANCVLNVSTFNLNSFDMAGYTGTFSYSSSSSVHVIPTTAVTVVCRFEGTITGTANFQIGATNSSGIVNLYTGGNSFYTARVSETTNAGTVNLMDNLTCSGEVQMYGSGTFKCNNHTITSEAMWVGPGEDTTVNLGSSTINLNSNQTYGAWYIPIHATVIAGTSTINIYGTSSQFIGAGKTYNIVNIYGDEAIISGDNTFGTLNVNTAGLATGLIITSGSLQTVTNLTTNGYTSNLAKISSDSYGSQFSLMKTGGGTINLSYVDILDSRAYPANTWYSGVGSSVTNSPGWDNTQPSGGISSWTDLAAIGPTASDYYILTRNLLTTDSDYVGIGDSWEEHAFRLIGSFNGVGFHIDGLKYTGGNGEQYVGLFTYIDTDGASVKNLGLTNIDFQLGDDADSVGGLTGSLNGDYNYVMVENCYSTGTITTGAGKGVAIGGLFGATIDCRIERCWSSVDITCNADTHEGDFPYYYSGVGGLIGTACWDGYTTILYDCYATGDVVGYDLVGGLVGLWYDGEQLESTQYQCANCYATGNVHLTQSDDNEQYAGGLIGFFYNDGDIGNCYSTGDVSSDSTDKSWLSLFGGIYGDYHVNCGVYVSETTEAYQDNAYEISSLLEYHETDATVFYNKTHNIYTVGGYSTHQSTYLTPQTWDFLTPVWYENASNFPTLGESIGWSNKIFGIEGQFIATVNSVLRTNISKINTR